MSEPKKRKVTKSLKLEVPANTQPGDMLVAIIPAPEGISVDVPEWPAHQPSDTAILRLELSKGMRTPPAPEGWRFVSRRKRVVTYEMIEPPA